MPEGDTLFRTATVLRRAIGEHTVSGFETTVDYVRVVNDRTPVAGRRVAAVEARGKNLLIVFRRPEESGEPIRTPERLQLELLAGDLVLHTHLRMTGSWHIYRPGERWQKPEKYLKVVVRTEELVVPCFSAPVVELLTAREAARHTALATLGPDATTEEFDEEEALARIRRHPEVEIGVCLMDQRSMAGVGNIYKSEVLFTRRVSPFRRVRELSDDALRGLIAQSHRLLLLNRDRGDRQTHFGLDDRQRLWVYGRAGRPCRVCGAPIRVSRQGLDGRITFYCGECQI